MHRRIGQAFGPSQLFAQHAVHAGHHVAHHFAGGVPHAQVLAEFRIEGLEEGLVEVLNGVLGGEAAEEGGAVHAVQGVLGPGHDIAQAQGIQLRGTRQVLEDVLHHGHGQSLVGIAPGKTLVGSGLVAPGHPGGEHAVEQRLHQRRAEEVLAILALEAEAQTLFHGLPLAFEGGQGRVLFHPLPRLSRIARQQRGQILGLPQGRGLEQGPAQEIQHGFALQFRRALRMLRGGPELGLVPGDGKGAELKGLPVGIFTQDEEVAVVRHQHEPVLLPVLGGLGALGREPGVVGGPLDLHHAARGVDGVQLHTLPAQLFFGVQPEIGHARALVLHLRQGHDHGFQALAEGLQQFFQGRVGAGFRRALARGMDQVEPMQVPGDGVHGASLATDGVGHHSRTRSPASSQPAKVVMSRTCWRRASSILTVAQLPNRSQSTLGGNPLIT